MSGRSPVSPRLARALLTLLLPRAECEFVIGDLDTHDAVCRRLCHDSGMKVVAVDYRLAPEHPFPAAPDDVEAALRWVHAHAADLGCDPHRIAIAGDSAGAHLALVAARRAHGAVPTAASAVLRQRDGEDCPRTAISRVASAP